MTENQMAGWHLRLYGHEFESTPGVPGVHGVAKSRTRLSDLTDQLTE